MPGIPELMVIAVIALIIFGPKKLPELGKSAGAAIKAFKEGAEQIKADVENSTGMDEKSRRELTESLTFKETREDFAGLTKSLQKSVSLDDIAKTHDTAETKEEVKS